MTDRREIIVGLFARGRETGFAVFERDGLVRFGVRTVRGRKTPPLLQRIVPRLVSESIPDVGHVTVAAEAVDDDPASSGVLRRTLDEAIRPELLPGVRITRVSLSEAKRVLCGDSDATHINLLEATQTRFPLLRQPTRRAPLNGLPEGWTAAFAVALAVTALHKRHDL
ncbi:MAG: hypothetical protein O3A46_00065 [Candidatus Poribacteria bacterium]|nr:hypothetical protein [Candidatus Poribacteria bacterium]